MGEQKKNLLKVFLAWQHTCLHHCPHQLMNQFLFLQDVNLQRFIGPYDYVAKTDPDTFLTPAFFLWKFPESVEFVAGNILTIKSQTDEISPFKVIFALFCTPPHHQFFY